MMLPISKRRQPLRPWVVIAIRSYPLSFSAYCRMVEQHSQHHHASTPAPATLGELRYETPPIAGVLRPALRASAGLSDRQRPDLRLESFFFATLEAGVHLIFTPIPHIPAYQWGFRFTGIPTGHAVSLTVQGNSNGDIGSLTITITCS